MEVKVLFETMGLWPKPQQGGLKREAFSRR